MQLTDRLAGLTLRPEREAEIIDELAQHLDDQVRELMAGGATLEAARTDALAELDAPGELARRLAAIEQRPPLDAAAARRAGARPLVSGALVGRAALIAIAPPCADLHDNGPR